MQLTDIPSQRGPLCPHYLPHVTCLPYSSHPHSCSRLLIQPQNQVGQQLEEMLPQRHGYVKADVAYVNLARLSSKVDGTVAVELVDHVQAEPSIHTGMGCALVNLHLTPAKIGLGAEHTCVLAYI